MAAGKKIEGESEARRCLAVAKRSGLSAGEWARNHGIDGRSLHAWQVNLERRRTGAQPRRRGPKAARASRALVELVPAAPSAVMVGGARYILEVGGARIAFGDDVSIVTLRRVLEALRSC